MAWEIGPRLQHGPILWQSGRVEHLNRSYWRRGKNNIKTASVKLEYRRSGFLPAWLSISSFIFITFTLSFFLYFSSTAFNDPLPTPTTPYRTDPKMNMTKAEDTRPHLSEAFTSLGHAPFVQPSSYLRPPMASQPERPIDVEERQGLVSVWRLLFAFLLSSHPIPVSNPPPRTEAFCRAPLQPRMRNPQESLRSPLPSSDLSNRDNGAGTISEIEPGDGLQRRKGDFPGNCKPRPSSWRPISRS